VSHAHFPDTAGSGVDAKRIIDRTLFGLGLRGLAHMQGAPVAAAERGGGPELGTERIAKLAPAVGDALLAQPASDDLDELVGEHGDEQMPLYARLRLMIDGP